MKNNLITIEPENHGKKLTQYLKQKIHFIKNAQIYKIIRSGEVRIDGARVKNQFRIQKGQILRIPPNLIDKIKKQKLNEQNIPFDIIKNIIMFEDHYLLVINKPYAIPTQGGIKPIDKYNNIDHWLTQYKRAINQPRPLLVHRLDRITTGVLILAKNTQISSELAQQFKNKTVMKKYLAIVNNTLQPEKGTIEKPINKKENNQIVKQNAKTLYQTIAAADYQNNKYSLVTIQTETGRKHQIRIHLASKNCPILGDSKYYQNQNHQDKNHQDKNHQDKNMKNQYIYLHARSIKIKHPQNNKTIEFKAPLSNQFKNMIEKIGWKEKFRQFEMKKS